ncbi:MAG: cytoplasmic protein [Deltaproteobacteria bacterium]|nr:cytoplasmic protein [Deltaproteobacteria bacterium]
MEVRNRHAYQVIYLRERSFMMLKKDLIMRNPLRAVSDEKGYILPEGGLGAVVARAGVGKTALLVQLALNSLLKGDRALHVSLGDPVRKVNLWYKEVFNNIAAQYRIEKIDELWDELLPQRFIMTFNIDGFSVPRLEERLIELADQHIFTPQMILIDGLPVNEQIKRTDLHTLKELSQKFKSHIWFTVRSHRHEEPDAEGMPIQISEFSDLLDVVIKLEPHNNAVKLNVLKGSGTISDQSLSLDPVTMLIKE